MGNTQRKMTGAYYNDSGEIHVSHIGELSNYFHGYPDLSIPGNTNYGKKYCDRTGIPRNNTWCKIGDLSAKMPPDLFEQVNDYYLDNDYKMNMKNLS